MASEQWICTACETAGRGRKVVPGSFLIELFLWIVGIGLAIQLTWAILLLPAAYTGWRVAGKKRQCSACGSAALVPEDSPVGRKLLKRD